MLLVRRGSTLELVLRAISGRLLSARSRLWDGRKLLKFILRLIHFILVIISCRFDHMLNQIILVVVVLKLVEVKDER